MTDVAISEGRLIELLGEVLVADGSARIAKRRLAERGHDISEAELRALVRDHQAMYLALSAERTRAAEDAIAQSLRETAGLSQRVTRAFLEDLAEKIDEHGLAGLDSDLRRQLPQTIQALAKVTQTSVDKLLTITGRPQDGSSGDPLEGARVLVDLGVLRVVQPRIIDSTATES